MTAVRNCRRPTRELRSREFSLNLALFIAAFLQLDLPRGFAADNRSLSASKISLPSGPGSIEGLGESFEPQLNTGTYAMGLPLKLPPVRGAVQPEVRLAYNSGSGNGPLGLGWRLDVPMLQRQTDKGLPQYSTNDTFVTFSGEELVALADGTFRAENEASFTRWENLGANGWRATRRDGAVVRYGQSAQARQDHPTLGTFKWMLESAQDLNGNRVEYAYTKDAGEIYLSTVEFGRHATLPSSFYRMTFQYEINRPDCLTDYRGRFRSETRWRLASAALEFEGRRIRFWKFGYHASSSLSLLASFTQFGDERSNTGTNALLNVDYLPPVTFDYALPALGANRQWADVGPFQNIRFAAREAEFVDVNRDGLPDVLLYDGGRYYSHLNRGPGFPFGAAQNFTSSVFYPALDVPSTKLADLRGDGSLKVLVEEQGSYYYRAFTSSTTLGTDVDYLIPGTFPISDPEVQSVDIDNDRALDFVAADQGDSTFAMVLSRAGSGSATVVKSAPTPLAMNVSFAKGWQFADLNGDRMPDLAILGTVDEGGTFFYPGKGYGDFDTVQSMGSGPNGPTESDRADGGLTLVDIDGDGLADLVSETITDEHGGVVTRTESFYDDETFSGNNPGAITRGNLTLQRRLVNSATNQKINVSRNRYNGYGNVVEIYDPLAVPSRFVAGHARQIAYDPSLHTYPVTETIHIGGATPLLIVTAAYDFGLGVMTSSTDFNTNTSFYRYDTFGRIATITKPGDTTNAPTELYAYQLGIPLDTNRTINFISASKRETAGGGTLDSRLFFDGLGRKVMVRAEGETPGQTVVTDTVVYNDRRAVWKKYLPYFETGGLDWNDPTFQSGFVESHYDALGRVTRAYQPVVAGERAFAETVYEPLARVVRDEEQSRTNSIHFGSAMRHVEDGLRNKDGTGRLRQVREIVKITGSDVPVQAPDTWITSYEYNLLDQLTRITDSQANVKSIAYDGLARMIYMNDPNRGEMHYGYDEASNLRQTTDNKGQVIKYTYDGVNRIKTEDYLDGAGRSPDVEYFYDAALPEFPGENVRGQLAAVSDLSGEEHLSYDTRSRLASQTKRIPDPLIHVPVPFTTRYEYDSLDRLTTLTYPDGDQVTHLYNDRGVLRRITGGPSGSIISNVTYRASGQLAAIGYGNGVSTTYDYDPRLRLIDLDTDSPVAGKLIDFHYEFDVASNILRIDDNRDLMGQPDAIARKNTQLFGYDSLYRLTSVEYPAILTNAPGRIDYRYDRLGNMQIFSS